MDEEVQTDTRKSDFHPSVSERQDLREEIPTEGEKQLRLKGPNSFNLCRLPHIWTRERGEGGWQCGGSESSYAFEIPLESGSWKQRWREANEAHRIQFLRHKPP